MPAHRKPDLNIERDCPVCGVRYMANVTRLRHGRQTTCSRACSYRLRGLQQEDRVDLTCGVCGTQFTRPPSHIKSKYGTQFCSRDCHYIGRSLGLSKRIVTEPYRYTEEGRISLSRHGARAYATGHTFPHPETELAVAEGLAEMGIPFVHQQVFDTPTGAIVVDFWLPDRNTVLEIDGKDHLRQRSIERDMERDALLVAAGIEVVRVPDDGIPQHTRKEALRALGRSS